MANAPLSPARSILKNTTQQKLLKVTEKLPIQPKFPQLADFYARTQSFKKWPKGLSVAVSDLVKSGFSYLGYRDRVQCFYCGGILDGWQPGDIVDNEHARHLSHCLFIQNKLGKEQVELLTNMDRLTIKSECPSSMREHTVTTSEAKPVLAYAAAATPSSGPLFISRCSYNQDVPAGMRPAPQNLHPVAPRDIRARLDTEPSRQLLAMGYKKPLLAQVIGERLAETGDDFPSFMDFFMAVQHAERVLGGGAVDTLNDFYEKSSERMTKPTTVNSAPIPTTPVPEPVPEKPAAVPESTPTSTSSSGPASSGSQGNDSLKRKKECNVCMDKEADTVFMPCRHMCACESCANRLNTCPICRRKIEQCIKVYV